LHEKCNHRSNKNLTNLSESWKIQNADNAWPHAKAMVETFENKWPVSSSKQSKGKKHSFPPPEIIEKSLVCSITDILLYRLMTYYNIY